MSTSLARQLRKLAAPQTNLLKYDKKKPSLLFDPKEASNITRDEIYEIGLSGLEELEKLDARFCNFRETLFSTTSVNFERAIQTAAVNKKIDLQVEEFLLLVSPYFTLRSAQKALEWLVNRYHIHQFNVDSWMACILPFHDTKMFVRALQLLHLGNQSDKWNWLQPLQRPGVPLPKSVLVNHCMADPGFLRFICTLMKRAGAVHCNNQAAVNTFIAFFTTTIISVLEHPRKLTEVQLTTLMPTLLDGVRDANPNLVAGCYMMIAQLTRKIELEESVALRVVSSIIKGVRPQLQLEALTLLVIIYSACGSKLTSFPVDGINILVELDVVPLLATLAADFQVSLFCGPLIDGSLNYIFKEDDDGRFSKVVQFLVNMIDGIRFSSKDSTCVINSLLLGYINCATNAGDGCRGRIKQIVKQALTRLEKQYPVQFERAVHFALGSISDEKGDVMRALLGFDCDLDHTSLYLRLNHNAVQTRQDAVQSIVAGLKSGAVRNTTFVSSAIAERLADSCTEVVLRVLDLGEDLLTVLPPERQFELLTTPLNCGCDREDRDWSQVHIGVINLICSKRYVVSRSDKEMVDLFLAVLPFMFPVEIPDLPVLKTIAESYFGQNSPMLLSVSKHMAVLENANDGVGGTSLAERVYAVYLGGLTPLSATNLNTILFEEMLKRLEDSSSTAMSRLAIILMACPLVRLLGDERIAMSSRFVEVLNKLIGGCGEIRFMVAQDVRTFVAHASKGFIVREVLLFACIDILENVLVDYSSMETLSWSKLTPADLSGPLLVFHLRVFRLLVSGLPSESGALFRASILRFLNRMGSLKVQIFFLSLMWNDGDTAAKCVLRVVSLKMASTLILTSTVSPFWLVELNSFVVPRLLGSLTSGDDSVRRAAWGLCSAVTGCLASYVADADFLPILRVINLHRQEIEADADYVKLVLAKQMTEKPNFMNPCISALIGCIVSDHVPMPVRLGVLMSLERVKSVGILASLLPTVDRMIDDWEGPSAYDLGKSTLLSMILERFDSATTAILATEAGWKTFQKSLETSGSCISTCEGLDLSPQDILIEGVTRDFYCALPSVDVRQLVFQKMLRIVVATDKAVTVRRARRALKRMTIDATLLVKHLEFKPSVAVSETVGMKVSEARARRRQPTLKPSQSPAWIAILAVLEIVQSKKEISNIHLLVAPLFALLKSCLDEEEQTPLEYSKQLILSCLMNCCQKLPTDDGGVLVSEFNTGHVVQCIRESNNPQTHHQALLLLSLAAQLFPSHVLHNIMGIFTFMGTSVLKLDDAYSFQVIAKTLESVIPTLIEASMNTAVEPVVTTVVHVFADALPEVPEHRRIAVFDKLMTTLDPEVYLWLAPTLILANMATQGPRLGKGLSEDSKDRITPDVDFSLSVCHLYKPKVQLKACIRILEYLYSLPLEKDDSPKTVTHQEKDTTEGSVPFSLEVHSTRQLCHFKLLLVNFVSTLLSSNRLIEQLIELDDGEKSGLEQLYEKLIEIALQYTQSIARIADQPVVNEQAPNPKFWRALLHRCYDVIDRINSLLPRPMFISVVNSLLSHAIPSIRRRAMELLSAKLQHQSNFFSMPHDENSLRPLIPTLISIAGVKAVKANEEETLNQQTAFFTLKLLCRLMGQSTSNAFIPVLEIVVDVISTRTGVSMLILASAFLCLAELIQTMATDSLAYLPRYGSNLVSRLEDVALIENQDQLLLSVITAVNKMVETLPKFLVPYLPPILKQVCYLSAKYPVVAEKPSQLQSRLLSIRQSLATASVPRSLVHSVALVYAEVTGIDSGDFKFSASIEPLMSVLSQSFTTMSREDLAVQLPALASFFVRALDARSMLSSRGATIEQMNAAEEPVVSALVSLVLKLSEASFRPLFFQLYDWATRSDVRKERLITFYNLTVQIAEKLKGLFVLFAGHFLRNAAQVVVDTNVTQKGCLPFSGPYAEQNTAVLLDYVLRCLYRVCLHDNENFINKERFETLMEPLVDQLDNQLGSEDMLQERVRDLLVPLLAQMAVAASDDYLWKALHYQLLLKTRNNSPRVRLGSLSAVSALVEKLGEDYLAFLPEAIPFLAELLEDDDHQVEMAAQSTIQHMENMLGEPLQKYF